MPGFADLYAVLAWIDEALGAQLAGGGPLLLVPLAIALGLRHATDPDHLVAVGAFVGAESGGPRRAMRLGAWWGAGHAATLLLLGLPLIALDASPPTWCAALAEKAIGALIVVLAARAVLHRHRAVPAPPRARWGVAGVGVLHGLGGTGAIVLLLVTTIPDPALAALALGVFAPMSIASMALCSGALGWAMTRPGVAAREGVLVPALAALSVAFGAWYAFLI